MEKLVKSITLILLITGMLAACGGITPTPVMTQGEVEGADVADKLPPSTLPPSATVVPAADRIIFYYFVPNPEQAPPEGSVVISPDTYLLAPQLSEIAYSIDTAADLQTALGLVVRDARNGWISTNLDIVEVTFNAGHTNIVLQGEYFGVGSVTLIAARMQILLTIFANPAVQTATVTLNGDTIGNLGIAHSLEAKPADYVFTRAEIEAYMAAE